MCLRVAAIWKHIGKSVVPPLFSLSGCLFFSGSAFLVFYLPSIPPLFFCFFFFSLSFHCYHGVTGAWMSPCGGAHGWVAGIASHGSVLLSRGWLITVHVEAPGHPGHPPQLDAVVNYFYCFCSMRTHLFFQTDEEGISFPLNKSFISKKKLWSCFVAKVKYNDLVDVRHVGKD